MNVLQILGLIIPIAYLIWLFGQSIKACSVGKGKEPMATWEVVILFISLLVLGFTMGTLVPKF